MTARFFVFALLALGMTTAASAQVTYRHGDGSVAGPRPDARPYGADEDMSYATHPSFQIFATPGGPGVRVIERCAYPDGWNATDFQRDLNGIPTGIGHTCPDTLFTRHGVRARY